MPRWSIKGIASATTAAGVAKRISQDALALKEARALEQTVGKIRVTIRSITNVAAMAFVQGQSRHFWERFVKPAYLL
jgi:hypothetical protein